MLPKRAQPLTRRQGHEFGVSHTQQLYFVRSRHLVPAGNWIFS